MRIVLVGGGSGGSVAPLLAIAEEIKGLKPAAKFLFIGGSTGPEESMAKRAKFPFVPIASGKWRRYWSLSNLATPFMVIYGFYQSLRLLRSFKPAVCIGTGSFIQVPVLYAAWASRIPVLIHQQDVAPSLANTLCAPIARKISVSFELSTKSFFQGTGMLESKKAGKVFFTGNPVRREILEGSKEKAIKFFGLQSDSPTMLVLGGGTGAKFLNDLIAEELPLFTKTWQVIHVTGAGKSLKLSSPNYHQYEFMPRMDLAYAASDLVVSRAGLSTITELSALAKVSIIIPMPNTHQEENAAFLWLKKAAIVLEQQRTTAQGLADLSRKLLFNHEIQKTLSENIGKVMPRDSGPKIAKLALSLAESK